MTKVGILSGVDYRDTRFFYDNDYLVSNSARPISISLPLQEEPYDAIKTRSFFGSLLPEGFSRRAVASWTQNAEEDYIALLACLGKECIGAIQITEGECSTEGGYKEVDDNTLIELALTGRWIVQSLLVNLLRQLQKACTLARKWPCNGAII